MSNLQQLGYTDRRPSRRRSLPNILERQRHHRPAKTGSGKTAAFGLGIMQRLNPARWVVQALIICPTRELSEQSLPNCAAWRARWATSSTHAYGGASARPQIGRLGMAHKS